LLCPSFELSYSNSLRLHHLSQFERTTTQPTILDYCCAVTMIICYNSDYCAWFQYFSARYLNSRELWIYEALFSGSKA
ncbi:hypothetical protein WUBG_09711, partial [Wuchereria bancrofti]